MLIVNFKNYESGLGEKGKLLVEQILRTSKQLNAKSFYCPSNVELTNLKNPEYAIAQSVDISESAKTTGKINLEILKELGYKYTLLNHAENQLTIERLKESLEKCNSSGIKTIVCFNNLEWVDQLLSMNAYMYAYEPAELIGTKDSVVEKQPEILKDLTAKFKGKFLIGAGINTQDDFKKAYEMGVNGILLSSIVMASNDPLISVTQIISWESKYAIHSQ